jgi:hypothetical protein
MKASGAVAAGISTSPLSARSLPGAARPGIQAGPERTLSVSVSGDTVVVRTATLEAKLQAGFLVSLRARGSDEDLIAPFDNQGVSAVSLVYRSGETVGLSEKFSEVQTRALSATRAEIAFHNWDGDGILAVTGDPETGDLILEPSAYSSRPGVRACRWHVHGLRQDLELIAPFFQGSKFPLEDPLVRESHWAWPMMWEAGMAVLQGPKGGFWVHTRDNRYRYKSLQVGDAKSARTLGFDTEAYGPIDENLSAGGLSWRINVYEGDWKVPAQLYRDWLWDAYDLAGNQRADWIQGVRMAISWCPGELGILEALSRRADPGKILLHFHNWRTDPYDENYPTYQASESGRAFIERAQELGFRIMPHCNSVDMDPSHPVYQQIRDFQYRDIETRKILGWSWYERKPIGVPESNGQRTKHQDKKVMVKVHPGLSAWRSILSEHVARAANDLALKAVFLDVTLTTWNLSNSLVENTTSSEGMNRLIRHVETLGNGLVVGGEGLNEITFQHLSFGQAHLFKSWHESVAGLERAGGCPLNEFLFGRLARTFGYSGLSGANEDHRLRHRIHLQHNAIPTITIRSAREIEQPNPVVEEVIKGAA